APGVGDLEVVDESVPVAIALARVRGQRLAGIEAGGLDALDAHRQQGHVGDAGLDRMDRRVARAGVAEHELARQVGAEPFPVSVGSELGEALPGPKRPVATHALESAALEEHGAIEVARRVERERDPRTFALSWS